MSITSSPKKSNVIPIRPDLNLAVAHVLDALENIDPMPLKQTVAVPEPLLRQLEGLQETLCLKRCGVRSEMCLWCYLDQFMENLTTLEVEK